MKLEMETMNDETRVFFKPGDVVTLRQDLEYKPRMIVVRKETAIFKDEYLTSLLRGIRCRWFSEGGILQEATWNTKDLIKL